MTAMLLSYRRNALWIAAIVHRLSGLALAAFLPVHFLALGLATGEGAQFEGFLRWADGPFVKASETALVFLLVVHLLGGLRLLFVENFSWRDRQSHLALLAVALAALVAFVFLIRVL
ncbi:MAG TPA: succinate dehydrogenase, cytochrome b subunit [Microvirga sp.]|nr:succinate dehydrogenase, cytochrome b subunit [Microvirga sp.]